MQGEVLCEVWRGKQVESIHYGMIAVVQNGRLVYSKGDIQSPVYVRSALKPLQAWTALSTGMAEKFGFGPAEIAITCASHEASREQVAAVQSILSKIKLNEKHLLCGAHMPSDKEAAAQLIRAGQKPTALHNNCSGKHAGMLAACKAAGWPTKDYINPAHPLQQRNLQTVARFTGLSERSIPVGIDGCSAPTFAVPLERFAIAWEAFFSPRADERGRAILQAMLSHPPLIGYTCTKLIQAGQGQIVCKIGAEGVYGVAFPEAGAGMAIKNLDGSFRPLVPTIHAVAKHLNLLRGKAKEAVAALADGVQKNWAGRVTGKLVPKV
jgi:L-asparaginase II